MGSAKYIKYFNFKDHWGPLTLVPNRIVKIFLPEPALAGVSCASWEGHQGQHGIPFCITCRSPADPVAFNFLILFFIAVFPPVPQPCQLPVLRQVSSRFLWDKGAFVCSAAEGTQPGALCPHLPPHHTHPPALQSQAGKCEGFCQVSGSSQESGIKPHHQRNPDKKSIILLPGVVFQGGPGLGQGQALSRFCSVGFPGAFGGPQRGGSKWDPSFQSQSPGAAAAVAPPQLHIYFIYIFSSITKVNLISSLHQGFSPPA